MSKRVFIIALFISFISLVESKAQSLVTSMGGIGTGSGGSFTSTMSFTSFSGNNNNLTWLGAATSQSVEVGTITSLGELATAIEVRAYPNPAKFTVNLRIEQFIQSLTYDLCLVDGRVLQSGNIHEALTHLNLMPYDGHLFLLNISYKGSVIKRLKIIKH